MNKVINISSNGIKQAIDDLVNENEMLQDKVYKLEDIIKEARKYTEENQEEHKYTDRGGFTYTEGHFLRDSDTLLEILDKGE